MIQPASDIVNLARAAALAARLDPALVCAVCEQESGWNPWAVRFEPAFEAKYIRPALMATTEQMTAAMSWGLMQVMGETARELGFKGTFLPELADPLTGLTWGCAKLARALKIAGHPQPALELYNGGANKAYAQQVLARRANYTPPPAQEATKA